MKMVMAILHKDDELDTTEQLNKNQFFVTKLSTSGGFLKNKNTTILVVTDDEKVQEVLEIIKKCSGERRTVTYAGQGAISEKGFLNAVPPVPINVQVGGSTVFVLNVEQFEKF